MLYNISKRELSKTCRGKEGGAIRKQVRGESTHGCTIRLSRRGDDWHGVLLDDALNAVPFESSQELWKLLKTAEQEFENELARLRRAADTDYLTGVLNRRGLEQAALRAGRTAYAGAVFLDIDDFKQINDSQGHGCGDEVLRRVTQAICGCVRAEDTVGRVGGDEFVVLFQGMKTERALQARAQELLRAVQALDAGISVSIGAAYGPGLDYEALLRLADRALYQVKSGGKNGFALYDAKPAKKGAGP